MPNTKKIEAQIIETSQYKIAFDDKGLVTSVTNKETNQQFPLDIKVTPMVLE